MTDILLKIYNNYMGFVRNFPIYNTKIRTTKKDMFRYAVLVGGFSNYTVSASGKTFYHSMVNMALQPNGGFYTIGSDYKNAEQSIKTSLSFFMGMFAAEIVAEKVYGIRNLYHLTDPVIISVKSTRTSTQTRRRPDFFGTDIGGQGFLFEAKGTAAARPANSTVLAAKNQLSAVDVVKAQAYGASRTFSGSAINRYVVASSFGKNGWLTYHCVDPGQEGDGEIVVDMDKAAVLRYQNIMSFIWDKPYSEYGKYFIFDTEPYKLGLYREIYSRLCEYEWLYTAGDGDIEKMIDNYSFDGMYHFISERISDMEVSDSNADVSAGLNGVICL